MRQYHAVILTFWKFLKDRMEHFEDTDAYWDVTIGIADKLHDEHFRGTPAEDFASDMYMAVMNELSRIARKDRG